MLPIPRALTLSVYPAELRVLQYTIATGRKPPVTLFLARLTVETCLSSAGIGRHRELLDGSSWLGYLFSVEVGCRNCRIVVGAVGLWRVCRPHKKY
jgi:hypothetical protein